MNLDETWEAWAPADAVWSPWVKPVLFSSMAKMTAALPVPALPLDWETDWIPAAGDRAVLVLDLPGAEGVSVGVALGGLGYRPVPLYNAVPWAAEPEPGVQPDSTFPPLVDVGVILAALSAASPLIASRHLPGDAPAAFLLDSNRRTPMRPVEPGTFDNRSISFPTDFPSSAFLLSQGIQGAILVQRGESQPQPDLAHTLRRWEEAGLSIHLKLLEIPGPPVACNIAKPSRFRLHFYRALELLGFRRHVLGGFGGVLREPSAG